LVEPGDEPENQEGRENDLEEVAKRMLIEGYARKDIVEEIKEATGLDGRTIGSIRGNLARERTIPTKAQMRRMAREKPGPEALKFQEELEGVPFRRPRPPHVLIESILTQFGVKERAKEIIIRRCKRAGGMHPSDLDRSLMDLDTGVNRKESSYVTEEYYLALQAEEDTARQAEGRSWPMKRREPGGFSRYPSREDQPTGRQWGYDRSLGRPGDRYERGKEDPLTMRGLYDILERRERELEDRMRRSTLEDKMGSIGEDISVLATELRNLKDNPPVQPAQTGPSEYEKSLEHTIDRQDKRQEELMTLIKEERSEAKEDMKEIRNTYGDRVDKLQEDLKASERRATSKTSTEGYKADEIRLAADAMNRLGDIFETRGSPFKILVEGLPRLLGDEGRPPQRERGRPASVADLVGPDYVER